MIYMIQNTITGKYSKGGSPCPEWTDKVDDAKVWKKKPHVKSHLTNLRNYRERWGRSYSQPADENDPAYWIVIEAKVVPWNTYDALNFT